MLDFQSATGVKLYEEKERGESGTTICVAANRNQFQWNHFFDAIAIFKLTQNIILRNLNIKKFNIIQLLLICYTYVINFFK